MKIRECMESFVKTGIVRNESEFFEASVEYADPLFGVGSATSAGPALPAGSIHPSPETLVKDNGGYTRNQPIVGFGQAYVSGSGGVKCYGNFLLAPMVGDVVLKDSERAVFTSEGSEKSKCYEYSAQLENGIRMRVTPGHDIAVYEFEYPAGAEASLLLDVARKQDVEACMKEGFVTLSPGKKVFAAVVFAQATGIRVNGICILLWNLTEIFLLLAPSEVMK